MPQTPEDFAHGQYGDLSGVVFSASFRNTSERLAISDRFITPLFTAILSQPNVPDTVTEWHEDRGWVQAAEPVRLQPSQVHVLNKALWAVTPEALESLCDGCTPAQCIRCARAIAVFLDRHVIDGATCVIERD